MALAKQLHVRDRKQLIFPSLLCFVDASCQHMAGKEINLMLACRIAGLGISVAGAATFAMSQPAKQAVMEALLAIDCDGTYRTGSAIHGEIFCQAFKLCCCAGGGKIGWARCACSLCAGLRAMLSVLGIFVVAKRSGSGRGVQDGGVLLVETFAISQTIARRPAR